MSIGLLTSTIQVLKKVKEQADPFAQSLANGITALIKPGTDYSHLTNRKTRLQLVRLSAVVCGIELCYAAETAFVTPILLKLGVPMSLMTLVWCVSPLLGFFLVPILGSMSDSCRSSFGRRRPFIAILSIGIVLGLLLVPNGEAIGLVLGDQGPVRIQNTSEVNNSSYNSLNSLSISRNVSIDAASKGNSFFSMKFPQHHVAGILLTIFGVAVLDFSCDAAQSPSRAYLLDISVAEDHSPGLTTFTVMAGLGGSVGYAMGGIDWKVTSFGESLEGHVRTVFSIVLFIFICCLFITLTSFKEVPLSEIGFSEEQLQRKKKKKGKSKYTKFENEDTDTDIEDESKNEALKNANAQISSYGALSKESRVPTINVSHEDEDYQPQVAPESETGKVSNEPDSSEPKTACNGVEERRVSAIRLLTEIKLKTYLMSIVKMPRSLLILCLTNLFCWMSLVCFSLYFTDFVGQAVYGGDPKSPFGSRKHQLYDDGVRLGSFGMSLYSLSCALYSLCIEKLVSKFKAKRVYIVGQLVYTVGMVILACTRNRIATIILSPSAGIMYATLFTMPYLLVAHYHTRPEFTTNYTEAEKMENIRGLGTDIALVSSMVFLAQFLLSAFVGSIVDAVGSTVAVVVAAAILSFLGAVTATQVTYYDM